MQSPLDDRDVLYGFDMHGRSEPIRLMYHMKGEKYEDHRVTWEDWPDKYKSDMPMGALPVLKTSKGTFNQSNCIARYVARKLGFMGDDCWEATLHDVIQENVSEASTYISQLFAKKIHGSPEPAKNYEETKEYCLRVVKLIQDMAKKRDKKFLVGDQIGLGDIWLYTTIQYWKMIIPDITQLSEWLGAFEKKMESVDGVKSYLEQRPPNKMSKDILDKLEKGSSE